jgi:ubiquinone/menaquinone biosynthesis C-methylase UbiE
LMAPPSPYRLFDTFNTAYRAAALRAAIELDLFTAIGQGSATVDEIALKIEASRRGTRILCDTIVAMGFLDKLRERYRLTPESAAYLDRRSACYMGDLGAMSMHPGSWPHLGRASDAVRAGGAVTGDDADMEKELPDWPDFARAIAPMMMPVSEATADLLGAGMPAPSSILEIGAGHGLFGIGVARRCPGARLTALDWPGVLAVARANAERAGLADRFTTIEGSAFSSHLGAGYDLALAANFLHMFGEPAITGLLARIRAALSPAGRFALLEFVVDEDRTTPAISAIFAMIMLTATRDGDAYTFAEIEAMCLRAGFSRCTLHGLGDFEQRVVIAETA